MAGVPASSHGAVSSGLVSIFHSQAGASVASIDTGAAAIPATYTHLLVVIRSRTDQAVAVSSALLRVNNDSGANYDRGLAGWNGAAVAFGSAYAGTSVAMDSLGTSADANRFHVQQVLFPDYADTSSFKHAIISESVNATGVDGNVRNGQGGWTWKSTAAISRIAILPGGGSNLVAGSSLTVYGLS